MAKLIVTPQNLTEALAALKGKSERRIGNNTTLQVGENGDVFATLHRNRIVRYDADGVSVTWAGYTSSTTRDRLNQLSPVRANIKQYAAHLNGEPVDSYSWYAV